MGRFHLCKVAIKPEKQWCLLELLAERGEGVKVNPHLTQVVCLDVVR